MCESVCTVVGGHLVFGVCDEELSHLQSVACLIERLGDFKFKLPQIKKSNLYPNFHLQNTETHRPERAALKHTHIYPGENNNQAAFTHT